MEKKRKEKKAQVTIFIIIAILIVAMVVLFFVFRSSLPLNLGGVKKEINPSAYLQNCLENDIKENIEKISLQGGSMAPDHYIMYQGDRIEYLCYINEYYKTCTMQQPMLYSHAQEEIKKSIQPQIRDCFNSMKKDYEKQGYNVNLRAGDFSVELLPKRIVTSFNHTLILAKEDSKRYDSLKVIVNNNLYELISITNSILNWEASYGDAETTLYMDLYHDLKVEKKKQTDGSTIYILTDRNNLNKFQFAVRSIAWPPGFGG